jgi:aminoglycoside phosphotransferase
VIIAHEAVSGFVDWGRAGIADRYQDLALCARSIAANLGPEWVTAFFEHYGLTIIDQRKLSFYELLDEFF